MVEGRQLDLPSTGSMQGAGMDRAAVRKDDDDTMFYRQGSAQVQKHAQVIIEDDKLEEVSAHFQRRRRMYQSTLRGHRHCQGDGCTKTCADDRIKECTDKDFSSIVLTLSGGGGGGRGIYKDCDGDLPSARVLKGFASIGGGRDKYSNVDGDVPCARVWRHSRATPAADPTYCTTTSEPTASDASATNFFNLILKNTRSLTDDARIYELLWEAKTIPWDVILVNETWRDGQEEFDELENGHVWLGSGGTKGKHGVGALVHKRWKEAIRWRAISPRLGVLRLDRDKVRIMIIIVYMPHMGYPDKTVEDMYEQLSILIKEGRREKRMLLFGGDWNAEVRSSLGNSRDNAVGHYANEKGNARGEWLKQWAQSMGLMLANTFFKKTWGKTWTHAQHGRERQIDYVGLDKTYFQNVVDSEACDCIDMGSDHRAVKVCMKIGRKRRRPHHGGQVKNRARGWAPCDLEKYKKELDDRLHDITIANALDWKARTVDAKCEFLERTVNESALACRQLEQIQKLSKLDNPEAKSLILERQCLWECSLDGKTRQVRRAEISKKIQKTIRKAIRVKANEKIAERLTEFKDLGSIAGIKINGKKKRIASMLDQHGNVQDAQKEIANVFADFYAGLYRSRRDRVEPSSPTELASSTIPDITKDEIKDALKNMAKKKAPDRNGIVVEMLQAGSDVLLEVVAKTFNDVLHNSVMTPESWKLSIIKVLYKKGDPKLSDNYRPITLLPILYKVFSRMICARIRGKLEAAQQPDQAGFRAGYSCDDHLFTVMGLVEQLAEYQLPLWVCAVDFKKAFDTVEHCSLWQALEDQGVDAEYVSLFKRLYENQRGHVSVQVESKCFDIGRGTKQGDPVSPILFNSVLEFAMKPVQERWRRRKWGIQVGHGTGGRLCNLRFADDLLLMASSKKQLKSMLTDLIDAVAQVGLEIHDGKTKVLTNTVNGATSLDVQGRQVQILKPNESTMYLGRYLNLLSFHDAEINNRIDKAWKKFFANKQELCSKCIRLKDRLKLFQATVTTTVLYGSGSWVMTAEREQKLRVTQRRMLRWMIGSKWYPQPEAESASEASEEEPEPEHGDDVKQITESWVDWIRRQTAFAETQLDNANLEDWIEGQRRRKWRWAGHVARRGDSRWSTSIIGWIPHQGCRRVGRPSKRWRDDLDAYFGSYGKWVNVAQKQDEWKTFEDSFVKG